MMAWLVILLAVFGGLHLGLQFPTQLAIIGAAGSTIILWFIWKLKWIILGIIGLEEFFGNRDQDT